MTSEDIRQELEREPFVPLRLHLASGQKMDIEHADSGFLRQNTLLIVHRLAPGSSAIGNYDVVNFRLIERIELLDEHQARSSRKRRRAS